MLKRLHLSQYKAFEKFDITFRPGQNILVGPNNAGKSTIIAALRLCAMLMRNAQRINPSISISDKRRSLLGYPISSASLRDLPGYSDENVHYNFLREEARIELVAVDGATLTVVWPVDEEGFFYFDIIAGMNARRRSQVAEHAPSIGIVPALTPIDNNEELLTAKYIGSALGSRLTSRHFRNHMHHLQKSNPDEYEKTIQFICDNTPEISDASVRLRMAPKGPELDFFFTEATSNAEREVFWTGDGLQIWLQVLYHSFRQRDVGTLVLDEPDVFLHPDLQPRLVAMLEDLGPQIIVATHAPEVIAEASKDSVLSVDRSRRAAQRVRGTLQADRLISDLGSAFDLGIARALRSRVALFVEGQDMKILRILAGKAGARNLARERNGVAVVPLGGYSHWPLIEPFAWMKQHLLQDSVRMFVILDRDYRSDEECKDVVRRLAEIHVTAHIWSKKELENYLLLPNVIARVSDVGSEQVASLLTAVINAQAPTVEANMFSVLMRKVRSGADPRSLHEQCRAEFVSAWDDSTNRTSLVPGKDVLSGLNVELASTGGRTISARKLASEAQKSELDTEVVELLMDIEHALVERGHD